MSSFLAAARSWVDQIHVNASSPGERNGRRVWIKRRRRSASLIMRFANFFFRIARNPVEAIVPHSEWQHWEIQSFLRLHGPEFSAGADPDGTAWLEILPGESLSAHLVAGTLSPPMLASAGRELRRAHRLIEPRSNSQWSHGDPHSGNFLYEAASDRARLIDFEVRHLPQLTNSERHADDLLVLLQDICGRCPADTWPSLARAFLAAYDSPEILRVLARKLTVPPPGPGRLWWAVRTTWMKRPELERRLAQLRIVIEALTKADAPVHLTPQRN